MSWTKIRSVIGALFALALIFVMFCAISVKMGWQIPGVVDASRAMGFLDSPPPSSDQ